MMDTWQGSGCSVKRGAREQMGMLKMGGQCNLVTVNYFLIPTQTNFTDRGRCWVQWLRLSIGCRHPRSERPGLKPSSAVNSLVLWLHTQEDISDGSFPWRHGLALAAEDIWRVNQGTKDFSLAISFTRMYFKYISKFSTIWIKLKLTFLWYNKGDMYSRQSGVYKVWNIYSKI